MVSAVKAPQALREGWKHARLVRPTIAVAANINRYACTNFEGKDRKAHERAACATYPKRDQVELIGRYRARTRLRLRKSYPSIPTSMDVTCFDIDAIGG